MSQVQGLGLGLIDGDRLTHVGDVAVASRAEVVAAVLSARGRGDTVIKASLVRLTVEGPKTFVVFVEQPYLSEDAGDAKPQN